MIDSELTHQLGRILTRLINLDSEDVIISLELETQLGIKGASDAVSTFADDGIAEGQWSEAGPGVRVGHDTVHSQTLDKSDNAGGRPESLSWQCTGPGHAY